jgi:hypothetical protein
MSGAALLVEMEGLGIHITREGDTLRVRGKPGVRLAPHRERIVANKPALLAVLREREEVATLGLDPTLRWAQVSKEPVEASVPPDGWDGAVPADCGKPVICAKLGACPGYEDRGACPLAQAWQEAET